MAVSVRELHRLTAKSVEHHQQLHRSHHHVAGKVAAERRAAGLHVTPNAPIPSLGGAGGIEGSRPPLAATP